MSIADGTIRLWLSLRMDQPHGLMAWCPGWTGSSDKPARQLRPTFYVLDNLPVDVLFSSDFVFDHDIFGKHNASFIHYSSPLAMPELCNIRLIGQYSDDLSNLEDESPVDSESGMPELDYLLLYVRLRI